MFPWSLTRTPPPQISSCLSPPLRQICKLPHLCGNGREQERRKKEKNPPTCQQTGKKITQALSHSAVGLPLPPTVAAAPASWTETWICSAPFPVPSWLLSISPASNPTLATSVRVLDSRSRSARKEKEQSHQALVAGCGPCTPKAYGDLLLVPRKSVKEVGPYSRVLPARPFESQKLPYLFTSPCHPFQALFLV